MLVCICQPHTLPRRCQNRIVMRIGFGTCLEPWIPLYKPHCPRVPASVDSLVSFSILASIIMSVTLVNDTDIALKMHTGVYATDTIYIWPGEEKSITGLWTTWPYNPRAVKIRFLPYMHSTPELRICCLRRRRSAVFQLIALGSRRQSLEKKLPSLPSLHRPQLRLLVALLALRGTVLLG